MADPVTPPFFLPSAADLQFAAPPKPSVVDTKKAAVTSASTLKQISLGGANDKLRGAVAAEEGNLAAQTGQLGELANLTPAELALKYGSSGIQAQIEFNKYRDYVGEVQGADRGALDTTTDTVNDVFSGFRNSLIGLGAAGVGLVNDQAGVAVSQFGEDLRTYGDSQLSDKAQDKNRIQDIAFQLDKEDRQARKIDEAAAAMANGDFDLSALKQIGRTFKDTAGYLYENPEQAGAVVSEGIGSLLVAGPAGKLIGGGAKATALMIGAMEGGGAYSDVVNQIMALPEEQLSQSSEAYRTLRQTMGHEEAVKELATDQGALAGVIQGVLGVATGSLVSKFEANPFKVGGLVSGASNIAKETVEEAAQEASAGYVTGRAVQAADPTVDPLDQAGVGAVLGAAGGAGSAGVVQTPGLAASTAKTAVDVTVAGAKGAGNLALKTLNTNSQKITERLNDGAGTGKQALKDAGTLITAGAGKVAGYLKDAAEKARSNGATEETVEAIETQADTLGRVIQADADEINNYPAHVRNMVLNPDESVPAGESFPRMAVLSEVLNEVTNEGPDGKFSPEEKAQSALWLYQQVQDLSKLDGNVQLDDLLDDTNKAAFAELKSGVKTILSDKRLTDILEKVSKISSEELGPMPEVTEDTAQSPEVQAALSQQTTLAQVNPLGVDTAFLGQVLNQKKANITEADRTILQAAYEGKQGFDEAEADMLDVAQELKAVDPDRYGKGKTPEQVRDEILRKGGDKTRAGLQERFSQIAQSLKAGNVTRAQDELDRLGKFAQHMRNKLKAAEESSRLPDPSKNKVKFRSWTGEYWANKEDPEAGSIGIFLGSDVSVALGKMIHVEARATQNAYNSLLKIYGNQLTGKPLGRISTIPAFSTRNMLNKAVPPTAEEIERKQAETAVRQVAAARNKDKYPLVRLIASRGGIKKGGYVAKELASMGVTPQNRPTLFAKTGGMDRLDNVVASELEADLPGITQIAGLEGEDYLNEDGLIQALGLEAGGTQRLSTFAEQELAETERNAQAVLDADRKTEAPKTVSVVPAEAPVEPATEEPVDVETVDVAEEVAPAPVEAKLVEPVLLDTSNLNKLPDEQASLFSQAYTVDANKSRLMAQASPLQGMLGLLRSIFDGSVKPELRYEADPDRVKAVGQMLRIVSEILPQKLNQRLKTGLMTQAGVNGLLTPLEILNGSEEKGLKARPESLEWQAMRSLALVDPTTGEYDPRLLEAAVVATTQWLLSQVDPAPRSEEDLAKKMNLELSQMNPTLAKFLNSGVVTDFALQDLSKTIMQFWGATEKDTISASHTQGIVQALSTEIILALDGSLLERESTPEGEGTRRFSVVRVTNENVKAARKQAGPAKNLMAELSFDGWATSAPQFDQVPQGKKGGDTVKGTQRKLGKRLQKALNVHREIAFKQNTSFIDVMVVLGKERYMKLRGWQKTDQNRMNTDHYDAVEGLNQSLSYNWDKLQEHLDGLRAYVAANPEKTMEEVAIHFDHEMVESSRIHAQDSSYQANKLVREALVATEATYDVTDPTGQGAQDFWLTVAQAFGVKTENVQNEDAVAVAQEQAGDRYKAAIEAMEAALVSERDADIQAFYDALMAAAGLDEVQETPTRYGAVRLKTRSGGPVSDKLIHALHAVARYNLAQREGGDATKAFKASLSLEADGKTDGPSHAIGMMDVNLLTTEGRQRAARSGYFINSPKKTLADHISEGADALRRLDVRDLYQAVADTASELVQKSGMKDTTPEHDAAISRMLSHIFNMQMGPDGKVKLSRLFTKNPTTIVIYGSGERGIAGKVAYEIRQQLAELMTELMTIRQEPGMNNAGLEMTSLGKAYPELASDLEILTTAPLYPGQNGDPNDKPFRIYAPKTSRLSRRQLENLETTVLRSFITPMVAAIDKELGGVVSVSRKLQAMTQIQGAVVMALFREGVVKEVEAQVAAGTLKKGQLLSKKSYQKIYNQIERFGVVVTDMENMSGDHNLVLGDKENAKTSTDITRSFDGQMKAPGTIRQPKDVGVAFGPQFVISRGDAEMMINYFIDPDADLGVAPVFDGLEMRGDRIREISEKINKAVYDTWLQNPLKDVELSWKNWLRQGDSETELGNHPIHSVGDYETLNQIFRSLQAFDPFAVTRFETIMLGLPEKARREQRVSALAADKAAGYPALQANMRNVQIDLLQRLRGVTEEIEDLSDHMEAVKTVMKEIPMSVDHMASGKAPYINREDGLIEGSEEAVSLELERRKEAALTKIRARRGDKPEAYQEPTDEPGMSKLVQTIGKPVNGAGGVRSLSVRAMKELAHVKDVMDPHTTRLLKALVKFLPEETTYYFGSEAELKALRTTLEGEDAAARLTDVHGQFDSQMNRLWVVTNSQETLLHETLHAALQVVLTDYYTNQGAQLQQAQKDAIENLEKLMSEFMGLGFNYDSGSLRQFTRRVKSVIRGYLETGTDIDKANALSEFLAYTLASKPLAEKLKETRSTSRLKAIFGEVLAGMRKLFRLAQGQPMDMFNQIYFNTAVAMMPSRVMVKAVVQAEQQSIRTDTHKLNQMLDQKKAKQQPVRGKVYDQRMQELLQTLHGRVRRHLQGDRVNSVDPIRTGIEKTLQNNAQDAVNIYGYAGFSMTADQESAFRSIHAGLSSGIKLNQKSLVRLQTLYGHVTSTLKVDDFLPLINQPLSVAADVAQEMFDAVLGSRGVIGDLQKRSTLMISFLALAQVHPGMREVLSKMPMPTKLKTDVPVIGSVDMDTNLGNLATNIMSSLEVAAAKQGRGSATVQEALDNLADALATEEDQEAMWAESRITDFLNVADRAGRGFMDSAGAVVSSLSDAAILKARNDRFDQLRSNMRMAFNGFGNLIRSDASEKPYGESLLGLMNSVSDRLPIWMKPLTELVTEIIGQTDVKAAVYRMLNESRYLVGKMRQAHRENVPDYLNQQFKAKVPKEVWETLHRALGETDVAVLLNTYTVEEVIEFYRDPTKLSTRITDFEDQLKQDYGNTRGRGMVRKSRELARFLATGDIAETNHNMLSNAFAIAHLVGEQGQQQVGKFKDAKAAEKTIDDLVSLLAIQELAQSQREQVVSLYDSETDGMKYVLAYLAKLRADEQKKLFEHPRATPRINQWKGHIPTEGMERVSLEVAPLSEHAEMVRKGYTKISEYEGSGLEGGRWAYYYSTSAGKAPFIQGAFQVVQKSVNGVDPRSGISVRGRTGGVIQGRALIELEKRVMEQRQLGKQSNVAGEPLLPVYDENLKLRAFERHVASYAVEKFQNRRRLDQMMGAWAGRQAEEALAEHFNKELLGVMGKLWKDDVLKGEGGKYVDMSQTQDPIWKEAYEMLPAYLRKAADEVFDGPLMIRKDMIETTIGYRLPSAADMWQGGTRWSEETQKHFRQVVEFFVGTKGFNWLVNAERAVQGLVSWAKTTFVVRSIIVPINNIASAFNQLMVLGLTPSQAAKGMITKLVETNRHLKNIRRLDEIQIEMAKNADNAEAMKRLEAEQRAVADAEARMSIHPLIQAGEFTAISEGLTETDQLMFQGEWVDKLRELSERIPEKLGTFGRYAVVTENTALFRGMARAVQYGDFLAKGVYYDHQLKQGVAAETALNEVREEFVNYNVLPGRSRSILESLGLTWFWAYAIRSTKKALRAIQKHPARVLMMNTGLAFAPDFPILNVGTPQEDNIFARMLNGSLPNSMGPDMLFRAWTMNPWVNLAG